MIAHGLAIGLSARRIGLRISEDTLRRADEHGALTDWDGLVRVMATCGVSVRRTRMPASVLPARPYLFPCAVAMRDGGALVVLSVGPGADGTPEVTTIDPAMPAAEAIRLRLDRFAEVWSGELYLIDPVGSVEVARIDRPAIVGLMARRWPSLLVALALSGITSAIAFAPIIYMQIALDKVVGYKATATLMVLTAGVAVALALSAYVGYVRDVLIDRVTARLEARLSSLFFDRLLQMPAAVVRQGDAAAQAIPAIGGFTGRTVRAVLDLSAVLVLGPILMSYSVVLGGLTFAFAAAGVALAFAFRGAEVSAAVEAGRQDRARGDVLRETIAGVEEVKAFGLEDRQRRSWRATAFQAIVAAEARGRVGALAGQLQATLQTGMTVVLVFAGVELVLAGLVSPGALVAASLLGARITAPIQRAASLWHEAPTVRAGLDALSAIWDQPTEAAASGVRRAVFGEFRLHGVSVQFGRTAALAEATAMIPARRTTAVVGAAGAGKTTLLRLLAGHVRVTGGHLMLDGVPLSQFDPNDLRAQVLYLGDQPRFFNGTVDDNIRRARPNAGEREVEEAIRLSALDAGLNRLPDGLSTIVDYRGTGLSSADRQRLALARAILSDPRVLLLDEATSAFDRAGTLAFAQRLTHVGAGRTVVIATNDLGLASTCEFILVLDGGRVSGFGNHRDLIVGNQPYRTL
jgi:ATP-binding cassette subfamily B protein